MQEFKSTGPVYFTWAVVLVVGELISVWLLAESEEESSDLPFVFLKTVI